MHVLAPRERKAESRLPHAGAPLTRRHLGIAFGIATAMTILFPLQHTIADWYTAYALRRAGHEVPPMRTWLQWQVRELPNWYGWLVLALLIYAVSRRFPLLGPQRVRNVFVHLALAISMTLLMTTLLVMRDSNAAASGLPLFDTVLITYLRYLGTLLVIWGGIVALQQAFMYSRAAHVRALEAAALQRQLTAAQLDVLKMQIHPHFLFNVLNTVAYLMMSDVPSAQRMIARLSDLLRLSLEGFGTQEVPLHEELRILDHYLAIQQVRFGDRLQVTLDVAPDVNDVLVPRLFLQPLVENSIRHGIERVAGVGSIVISAHEATGMLHIRITDNGAGIDHVPTKRVGGGVGLRNTRSRLQQLYGDQSAFELRPVQPRGTEVVVTLPVRRKGTEGAG